MPEHFYDTAMAERQQRLAATADMQRQRAILADALALAEGESVLELGCGNGILARDLCQQVGSAGEVVGLDQSEAIIGMARQLCPDTEFRIGDAAELPFGDGHFDAAVAAQLLCFLPDVPAVLTELWRVLKPGGRVVLLDTDWGSLVWNTREPELMQRVVAAYTSVYADAHVPRTLSRRLEEAGFAIADRFSFTVLDWSNGDDTYAWHTVGFALPILRQSDAFPDVDVDRWLSDQEQLVADGEYFFSLNRYVFVARKT